MTLTKCREVKIDEEIYKASLKISSKLDSTTIQPFRDWNCVSYDNKVEWNRIKRDGSFSLTYQKINETEILSVNSQPLNFQKEYNSNFTFDTASYNKFSFYKQKNTISKISFINKLGAQVSKDTSIRVEDLFSGLNPFLVIDSLTILKQNLKILYSNYFPTFGNFIQFSPGIDHTLYYLPSDLKFYSKEILDSDSSEWKKTFVNAEKISNGWVLVHFKNSECKNKN